MGWGFGSGSGSSDWLGEVAGIGVEIERSEKRSDLTRDAGSSLLKVSSAAIENVEGGGEKRYWKRTRTRTTPSSMMLL